MSNIGINPIPFANKIKKKNVRIMGAHVSENLAPTFGLTIESRIKDTMDSIAFIQPVGIGFSFFKYLRTGIIIETERSNATIHNINTCFVTEISMPKI